MIVRFNLLYLLRTLCAGGEIKDYNLVCYVEVGKGPSLRSLSSFNVSKSSIRKVMEVIQLATFIDKVDK